MPDADGGLEPNIVAALDEVLNSDAGDPVLVARLRRLVENCLGDNYDTSDVLAVIELAEKAYDEDGVVQNGA
jgi:hypothetical protein